MRFLGQPSALLRRWYPIALGLVITAALCALAYVEVPPRQEMSSSVLLMPPQTAYDKDKGGNPYLVLGGMEAAVDVVAREMSGETLEQQAKAMGADSFTLERDSTTPAPILLIKVAGKSPEGAQAGLTLLTEEVPKALTRLQDAVHVPQNALISSTVVAASVQPTVVRSSQLRALMMAGAGGLMLTLLLMVGVDNVLRSRRRRRSGVPLTMRRLRPKAASASQNPRKQSVAPLVSSDDNPAGRPDLTTSYR
jgi:hypothetical protein